MLTKHSFFAVLLAMPVLAHRLHEGVELRAGGAGSNFGSALSIDGAAVLVGAPAIYSRRMGEAHVFERSRGAEWTLSATLRSDAPQDHDTFGGTVCLVPSMAVVGAPTWDSDRIKDCGVVHVYREGVEGWTCSSCLLSPRPVAGGRFGSSLASDGRVLAVGAPGYANGEVSGAVTVFELANSEWSLAADLAEYSTGEQFGYSLSLANGLLVVGAPASDDGAGAAYFFEKQKGAWVLTEVMHPPNPGGAFGWRVAAAGDWVLVSAPRERGTFASEGAVYTYCRDAGGGWKCERISSSDQGQHGPFGARFGFGLDVSGGRAVIGTLGAGYVSLWSLTEAGWAPTRTLAGGELAVGNGFGAAVGISEEFSVVGAPFVGPVSGGWYSGQGSVWSFALD